jgi:hypothetical protein
MLTLCGTVAQLTQLEGLTHYVRIASEWNATDAAALSLAKVYLKCYEELSPLQNLTKLSVYNLEPATRSALSFLLAITYYLPC